LSHSETKPYLDKRTYNASDKLRATVGYKGGKINGKGESVT